MPLNKMGCVLFSVLEGKLHSTACIHTAKPTSSPKQVQSKVATSKLLTGKSNPMLSRELYSGIVWEGAVLHRSYL